MEGQASVPGHIVNNGDVMDICAGYKHSCVVKADRRVKCWGNDDQGQCSFVEKVINV